MTLASILRALCLKRSNPVEDCPYSLAYGDVIAFPNLPTRRPFDTPVDPGGAAAPKVSPGRGGEIFHTSHDQSE